MMAGSLTHWGAAWELLTVCNCTFCNLIQDLFMHLDMQLKTCSTFSHFIS